MIDDVFAEVRAAGDGSANGSIICRNTFQRPKVQALNLLNKIYLDKDRGGRWGSPF